MADYNYLSDGRPAGSMLGNNATDKVGFHGVAPTVQGALVADATDAATAITRINLIIDLMIAKGLMASA